jgi:hypothetical protein
MYTCTCTTQYTCTCVIKQCMYQTSLDTAPQLST